MLFIVEMERKNFLTKLFLGDGTEIYKPAGKDGCMMDQFSEQFFQKYPTVAAYASDDGVVGP